MRAVLAAALFAVACGAGNARLGAREHEEEALREELRAGREQERYDAGRTALLNECPFSATLHDVPCWTADRNPTAVHLQEAARHREHAAQHRAQSRALREAEARACSRLTGHDRDTSPFAHRDDVIAVGPLVQLRGEEAKPKGVGAAVTFRAVPGLTVDRLQQLVDCHLARNAALGFPRAQEPDDPLDVPGVRARVTQAGDALRVELRGGDPAACRQVLERARQLTAQR